MTQLLFVLACLHISSHSLQPDELRAGAARVDITPPIGYPMWGYGARHNALSQGVLEPLMAKAIVIEVGSDRLAIVGTDIGRGPTRAMMAQIRKEVADKAGLR